MALGHCSQFYEPEYGPTFEQRRARLQLVSESYRPPDAWSAATYQPDPPQQLYWPEYASSRASIWYWPCRAETSFQMHEPPALRLVEAEPCAAPTYEPEYALLYGLSYLELAAEAELDEWQDDWDDHFVQLQQLVASFERRRGRRHLRLI